MLKWKFWPTKNKGKTGKMKLLVKILQILFVGLLLLFGVSFIYEQYSRSAVKKEITDSGTYADIGGYRLHMLRKEKLRQRLFSKQG